MKVKHVFLAQDVAQARAAVAALRGTGVEYDAISLVARSDIELDAIPDRLKEADTDLVPAAVRGVGIGGATGLLAGLAATVFAPIGITLAGAAAIGAMGALVGGWSSALMGSALPDPVRQKFEDEIAAGRILVILDADADTHARVAAPLAQAGVIRLDYEAPSALS